MFLKKIKTVMVVVLLLLAGVLGGTLISFKRDHTGQVSEQEVCSIRLALEVGKEYLFRMASGNLMFEENEAALVLQQSRDGWLLVKSVKYERPGVSKVGDDWESRQLWVNPNQIMIAQAVPKGEH